MTHALETAEALNDAQGGTSWATDVAAHMVSGGGFIASVDSVILFRPVWSHWSEDDLGNPWKSDAAGDAWYIWIAVGDLSKFTALARSGAWPIKESVAFHRRGNSKWYRLATLIARIDGQKTKQLQGGKGTEAGQ